MLNIQELGPRIDKTKAATLIGIAIGKDKVSSSTLWRWVKQGKFPKPLENQLCQNNVWSTKECLEKLGLLDEL